MTEILDLNGIRSLRHGVDRPDLGRVALVPTMGALHEGHLALVQLAQQHADTVIVSIFVNPLQFGPGEDFEKYPRQFAQDLAKLEAAGAQYVFQPTIEEMYPNWPATTTVSAGEAGRILEGAIRPGHFDGVLTVVAKLFALAAPDLAVFGQKDAQQLALIRRMVRELHLPLDIIAQPIVREDDGLARSSRNVYLSAEERARALTLWQALRAAAAAASEGLAAARAAGLTVYAEQALVSMDYLEFVEPERFTPVAEGYRGEVLALTAARVGATRLIDNLMFRVGE